MQVTDGESDNDGTDHVRCSRRIRAQLLGKDRKLKNTEAGVHGGVQGTMSDLFREIMIWKRLDGLSAVRYSCFENLQNGKFSVQSADFYRLPLDNKRLEGFNKQFTELFIEVSPHERCKWFDSIEEAIFQHDLEFSE